MEALKLEQWNVPPGLSRAITSCLQGSHRYYIIDDSGSMSTEDGNRISSVNDKLVVESCSRWGELSDTVMFHSSLAYQYANIGTMFHFINRQPILVTGNENSLQQIQEILLEGPGGGTPLCAAMTRAAVHIRSLVATDSTKPVSLIIATDGEPSDGDIRHCLDAFMGLPVRFVIRLYTGNSNTVAYWNNVLDQLPELKCDVLDDLISEAREVSVCNPGITYNFWLHELRTLGSPYAALDHLDEFPLTRDVIESLIRYLGNDKVYNVLTQQYQDAFSMAPAVAVAPAPAAAAAPLLPQPVPAATAASLAAPAASAPQPVPASLASQQVQVPLAGRPTILPRNDFKPLQHVQTLRETLHSWFPNTDRITDLVTSCSANQRLELAKAYKTSYGKDLLTKIHDKLDGYYGKLILALLRDRATYEAECLIRAIKASSFFSASRNSVLAEVLLTKSNSDIVSIKQTYGQLSRRELSADIARVTSGNFRKLLVSCLEANRDESSIISAQNTISDAESLYQAGEARWGTDESVFIKIMMTRSLVQISEISKCYRAKYGHYLSKALQNETSGSLLMGFQTVLHIAENRLDYYAERIYQSMDRFKDESMLTRLLVCLCETDLADVKDAFFSRYQIRMSDFLRSRTRGPYRKAIYRLLGERYDPK